MFTRQGNDFRQAGRGQVGAVLFISLVLLLLMTLAGLAAMNGRILQERMTGNALERNRAFQASEAALGAGEAWLASHVADLQDRQPLPDGQHWDGSSADGAVTRLQAGLAAAPVFHVGPPLAIRVGVGLGSGIGHRCVHAVTSRGVGATANAVVVLRSHFVPQPDCQ